MDHTEAKVSKNSFQSSQSHLDILCLVKISK